MPAPNLSPSPPAPYHWLPFVLPFAVYMLVDLFVDMLGWTELSYPVFYTVRISLTLIAMLAAWPVYLSFPWRVSRWSILVGCVGGVLWIGLCRLNIESTVFRSLGLAWLVESGARPAFDPFSALGQHPWQLAGFLAVRFLGLVLVIPIIEEFFLRGFLLRLVVDERWQQVPFGTVTTMVIVTAVGYAVLTHPAEMLAAATWFSLVTWLMAKTRSLWDCVVAHSLTNLALGLYVVITGHWSLW